jgi:hypothetical protein
MQLRTEWLVGGLALMLAACAAADDSDGGEQGAAGTGGKSTAGAATTGGSAGAKAMAGATNGGVSSGGVSNGGKGGTTNQAGKAGAGSGGSSGSMDQGGNAPSGEVLLPEANAGFDYQIGGGYDPPAGVTIVSRDRGDTPAPGIYNICYVNGFQAQQSENALWLEDHPDLVLRDEQGEPVIDPDWNEMLLDTSSEEKRAGLAQVVGGWIQGCADSGFDAVEIDNLDTYSRSGDRLSEANNVAFMKLLSDIGHQAGLAMGQKNSAEIVGSKDEMGTDFAVAEECNHWDECGDYQAGYGDLVFIIEYADADFTKGCQEFPELSIVRRDVDVTTPGSGTYKFEGC